MNVLCVDGLEQFRLGKLYADAGKPTEAERWFAAAVVSFSEDGAPSHDAYLTWAASYLADASFDRQAYVAAAEYYERLYAVGKK